MESLRLEPLTYTSRCCSRNAYLRYDSCLEGCNVRLFLAYDSCSRLVARNKLGHRPFKAPHFKDGAAIEPKPLTYTATGGIELRDDRARVLAKRIPVL